MNTIPEMFREVARANATRPAIVAGSVTLTYAQLEKRVAILAAALDSLGARQGDRIALLLPNGPDFVVAYFAILVLGAIAVPLNEHYEKTELVYFINECGVSILVTGQEFQPLCETVLPMCTSTCRLFYVEDQPSGERSLDDFQALVHPDAPAIPVLLRFDRTTQTNCAHAYELGFELNSLLETLGFTPDDRFIGVAPFSHVNGLMRSMLACIRAGSALYPLSKFERYAVVDLIEKNWLTVFIAVPFMFSILAQTNFASSPDFSSLRYCISASAPMPTKFNRLFHEKFNLYVRQLYGSTETGTISVNLHPDIEHTLESVGMPIHGSRFKSLLTRVESRRPAK
jgi:long-chain acyl-CoA synthetase